jgi:hypothetical protein
LIFHYERDLQLKVEKCSQSKSYLRTPDLWGQTAVYSYIIAVFVTLDARLAALLKRYPPCRKDELQRRMGIETRYF